MEVNWTKSHASTIFAPNNGKQKNVAYFGHLHDKQLKHRPNIDAMKEHEFKKKKNMDMMRKCELKVRTELPIVSHLLLPCLPLHN